MSLEARIKEQAHALGFERAGIAAAGPADGFARLQDWLQRGFAGEMDYMTRHEQARRHPESVMPGVRSVLMVAMNYLPEEVTPVGIPPSGRPPEGGTPTKGEVARYARGEDYHDVLRGKLQTLLAHIQGSNEGSAQGKAA